MPTGEELEEQLTRQMEQERVKAAILNLEIETLKKAVKMGENISRFPESSSER